MFVSRQEGLRPEEPKTGLSSAAFLAACEGEVTQVWKRLLPWLLPLSGTGWKRLCHFSFGRAEGKVGRCCVRSKVLKAANMKTFWERDANCVVESRPLWTHPTVITVIGARTGPRGLSNKETKGSLSGKKGIKRRAGQRWIWEPCGPCEGSV